MDNLRYGDNHRHFLLYVLKEGCLNVKKVLDICKNANIDVVNDEESLNNFIQTINKQIDKHSLHIGIKLCEVTGGSYVVLNDVANDHISRIQKRFKEMELKYFEKIVKEIVCSRNKQVLKNQCLNIASKLPVKISIVDAEVLLKKWEKMGYLVFDNRNVMLGVRCLSEYTQYFWKHFEDYIKSCNLCSELVFYVC